MREHSKSHHSSGSSVVNASELNGINHTGVGPLDSIPESAGFALFALFPRARLLLQAIIVHVINPLSRAFPGARSASLHRFRRPWEGPIRPFVQCLDCLSQIRKIVDQIAKILTGFGRLGILHG